MEQAQNAADRPGETSFDAFECCQQTNDFAADCCLTPIIQIRSPPL